MGFRGGVTLIILSRRLLIEAYVVALLKRAGAINEAGGRSALVRSATLNVSIPRLSQQAHVVVDPVAKPAPIVVGSDGV